MKRQIRKILSVLVVGSSFIFSSLIYSDAGIIPYIIQKNNNKTYVNFLLSVEKRSGKNVVTDFGGGGKGNQKDTAAKEGYEETMGMFTVRNANDLLKKKKAGVASLRERIQFGCGNKNYKTYFVNVTDKMGKRGRAEIVKGLSKRLAKLKVYKKFKGKTYAPYREKRGFVWLSKKELTNVINNNLDISCQVLSNFKYKKNLGAVMTKTPENLKLYWRLRDNLKSVLSKIKSIK